MYLDSCFLLLHLRQALQEKLLVFSLRRSVTNRQFYWSISSAAAAGHASILRDRHASSKAIDLGMLRLQMRVLLNPAQCNASQRVLKHKLNNAIAITMPQSTYVCLGEITIYNHFNVYSFTNISILTINNSSCVKGRPNIPLMTRHLANPSDLSKMMRIRACLRQCSTPERVSSSTSDKSFCSLLATSRCRNCLHARPYSLGIGWNSNSRSSC